MCSAPHNLMAGRVLCGAGLVSHVWQQVVAAIHSAEPINEAAVGDMFDEACEVQHVRG